MIDNEKIEQMANEIEEVKQENARLTAKLGQVLLSIDTVKEMNAMCDIHEQRKRAVQDFVVKLKEKCNGIWKYECSFENIIPFIQELLKEYE